jgi:hypothetical protein
VLPSACSNAVVGIVERFLEVLYALSFLEQLDHRIQIEILSRLGGWGYIYDFLLRVSVRENECAQ